jgi:hypothetical protein
VPSDDRVAFRVLCAAFRRCETELVSR